MRALRSAWRWLLAAILCEILALTYYAWWNNCLAHAKQVVTAHLEREIIGGHVGEAGKRYAEFAKVAGSAKKIEAMRSYMQILGTPLAAEAIVTREHATFRETYWVSGTRLSLVGYDEVVRPLKKF